MVFVNVTQFFSFEKRKKSFFFVAFHYATFNTLAFWPIGVLARLYIILDFEYLLLFLLTHAHAKLGLVHILCIEMMLEQYCNSIFLSLIEDIN